MKFIERKAVEKQDIIKISEQTGVEPLIAKLLLMRDISSPQAVKEYLRADISLLSPPTVLQNIEIASDIVMKQISKGGAIVLYGDYDCDGIGAIAIMYLTLKALNARVSYYIPQRHEEGYGLSNEAILRIKNQYPGCLIVTVDCGITSVSEVEYAKSLGLQTIVTDHHEPAANLPDTVILNPILNEGCSPLCGAGVALKLAEQLTDRAFITQFLDICAVSTVADVVPLVGDNRIIVKAGLEMLSNGVCREGFKKLLALSNIKRNTRIKSSDIAYRIAPRLNASGRLSSAYKSLKLLIEEDATAISLLAEELEKENKQRQDIFTKVLNDALTMLESYDLSRNLIIILKSDEWEEGVIGIAASKIAEQFGRPTILLTQKGSYYKGSARSAPGINIYEVLSCCRNLLSGFGGHAMAAGLSLPVENYDEFLLRTNTHIKENTEKDCFQRKLIYDDILEISDINDKLFNNIMKLEPFGCGNPKPLFISKLQEAAFSRIGKYPHIKSRIGKLEAVAFNKGYALPFLKSAAEKTVSYTIDREYYNNSQILQCKIKDFYSHRANIDNEILFARFLQRFVCKGENRGKHKERPDNDYFFGTLYIAFSNETFNIFAEENPQLERFIFNSTLLNPYNAVILSPERDFVYTYYNKIVMLEKAPRCFIEHIRQSFGGKIANAECYPDLRPKEAHTQETLREDYKFIYDKLSGKEFFDILHCYDKAVRMGYKRSLSFFATAFFVFAELQLLLVNNGGIIEIDNKKVEIGHSEIYKWVTDSED